MEENKKIRKIMSVIMLVVFTASNFFEPFNYALAQETDLTPETGAEIVNDNSDTGDNEQTPETDTGDSEQQPETNTGDDEQQPETNTGDDEQQPETNTGDNEQTPETNTGDDEQQPETNTGDNEQTPETNTGDSEEIPETNTGDSEEIPETNTGDNKPEPEVNTGNNELEIDTDLWEEGEDFYDTVYTGVVRGKEYTITLMDRNLGATSIDRESEEAYGYYYQWGNNYSFSHHKQLNKYTTQQVDASGYGPDNRYIGEKFVRGHTDWSSKQNNNLWGGEGDNEDNDYNDESNRQGPCPEGYHVPSVGDWHALLSTFLVNNGIDETTTDGLLYPDYIGTERHAGYYLESEDIENFKETFNISYAGRIKMDSSMDRTGTTAHLWTSTPLDDETLGFEVRDDRINLGGWKTTRATAYPVRCFKSVESELIDYTITYVNGEEETTEIKHRGDILTEPEHEDKGEGYEWLGWYREGEDEAFDFTTAITGDVTLIATWKCADNYHEENNEGEALSCQPNTKKVECEQTGGVANSTYVVTGVEITWDITGSKWNEIPACEWECNQDYHPTGGQCESNTKIEECIQTGKVENSTYIVTGVEITRDFTGNKWNEIPACEWECDEHYHTGDDSNGCEIDTFQFTLVENSHINTEGSTESGKKAYDSRVELSAEANVGYRFLGWQIVGLNGTGISNTSVSSQVVFNMPARDVTATPLSSVIEYNIIYRNVDEVTNPTTYTVETPTFTLNEPTRTGYTFVGWTGSNGDEPQRDVTIAQGNYGDKEYNAVWEAKSGIEYTVVHAVEKANESSYEERERETLVGTTDEMTQAVAKEYTGFTAKTINQKVIKGDGSTVVRVQYQRNIYTIIFDSNGGSEVNPITGKYESNLTAPNSPSRGGYIFIGWEPSFPTTMPLGGAELTAQWKKRSGGGSSSSEDTTPTTGETTTGQNEIITGTVEEIIEEVENLNIDAGTSVAPMLGNTMKLGAAMLNAISPAEEMNEELEIARETLNKNKIRGNETYNNIIINVEAPKNSFPEKTQLRIIPITGAEQKQSIKEQLMENGNVTAESELVSFDVSFVYVLSNGEEIEVQPAEGQTVKVSFNYKNNNKLSNAKKNKNKELKVYHFEKIKNKKGKDTGKVEIKEIEINESESVEGEVVIDAENFSIYTIVDQLIEETNDQLADFEYDVITISGGTNGDICYTFMDRNLGATSNDISSPDSYGYYYQRGNNYGFTLATAQSNNSSTVITTKQNASQYYSKTFITQSQWYTYTQGNGNNKRYDGDLWGGGDGADFSNASVLVENYSDNYEGRQGPCPDGWHVPSAQEWSRALQYWGTGGYLTKTNGRAYFQTLSNGTPFQQWAKIPNAGTLTENLTMSNAGSWGKLWTSSAYLTKSNKNPKITIPTVNVGTNYVGISSSTNNSNSQGSAIPVRCFYNSRSCDDIPEANIHTGCVLPRGGTVEHLASVTGYTTSSATCPTACISATATCNNGKWSVNNFTGTYTNQTCTTNPSTCDASFTLNSTGANGIYSGCTTYTVNGNNCNAGATKYKLTNCANGYHTENNSTCVSNTKQVACAQSGKPVNSSYVAGNVTVTWQGTWNSGNWSTTGNCAWKCDPYYHTGANGTSCEIDQFLIRWIDGNAQVLTTGMVNYNVVPTYTGPTPTKTATAHYTYTWNNTWSPTPVAATTGATYTAQFNQTINQYNVIFDANGGTPTPATQNVEYGQTASKPTDPIKSGYVLTSWQLSGSDFDFSTPITGNINLVAQWRDAIPPTCTITQAACTSGALQLTLTGSETLQTLTGWTKVNDTRYTLNVTNNNAISVTVSDLAGNTGSCNITPTNYDVSGPNTPEIGCPTSDNIIDCIHYYNSICPQYDINEDGEVDVADAMAVINRKCTSEDKNIKVDGAITNNPNPRFVWITPNDNGCSFALGYEIQICSDSNCNTVLYSGTYAEVVGHTNLADGTYYWRVKAADILGNRGNRSDIWSFSVDATVPEGTLTGTNILNSESQRLTGTCTDAAGIAEYYLGTNSDPAPEDYNIANGTSYTTGMNITSTGTYYLFCKDLAGNISTGKSITYSRYTVNYYKHNLGATTYTLEFTDTFVGNIDFTVTISDLVRFITGHTFEAAYITGDTTKPEDGEITTTTILPDGSRVINMYYRPNYLYIHYDMNGGYLKSSHGSHIGTSGNLLTNYGSTEFLRGIYNSIVGTVDLSNYSVDKSGIHNVNNTNSINVGRVGYGFNSSYQWNTSPDGHGTGYNQGDSKNYSANGFAGVSLDTGDAVATLYVNWMPITYTITYNLDGGTETVANPTTYTIESGAITLQQPTKTGYIFLGWTGSNGNTPQTGVIIPAGSDGNKIYNAVWQPIEYNVTFDVNGGTPTPAAQSIEYGQTATRPADPINSGYVLASWQLSGSDFDFSTPITGNTNLVAYWEIDKRIILEATATAANQTLKIKKYFANAYTVDWGDGTTGNLTADITHKYSTPGTYTITLSLTGGADRWTFRNLAEPLVPTNGTTMTGVKITYMPSLADGFGDSGTEPGNYFFSNFNYNGQLTSLPEGSFDTSNITTVGDYFFSSFNNNGQLTSLPDGSFDTSKITTAGWSFFSSFNNRGALESLPDGSFDISNTIPSGTNFFAHFNDSGALTNLPDGSFRISTGLTTVGITYFFYAFNNSGALTNLPTGSFDTSNITTAGNFFFNSFNQHGALESLPERSFDTSNINTAGENFFTNFNHEGALKSLPDGSFRISTGLNSTGSYFFCNFNRGGALESLPIGSFDISHMREVGDAFFSNFNHNGALISLPEGSFDTSRITTVGQYFFYFFNNGGQLTSLPEGSFNLSHITTAGKYFFSSFNQNGKLTSLPESFKLTSAAYGKTSAYTNSFNSSNYTFNRKVSDLVSGITTPSSDRDTFSDNQPGRCGVHEYWLDTTADACSISYDDGQGGTGEFKYNADTTGVVAGSGISVPTRSGYIFSGWQDASGNKVDEVLFPEMDGQTLYAKWKSLKDIDIEATATADNQKLKINKYFKNVYTVDWGDGITETLTSDTTHTYARAGTYTITLSLLGTDRWTFREKYSSPLVPKNGTTMTGIKIVSMPSLADGFGESASNPGDYFFSRFNNNGAITSLPANSFDTSNITAVGGYFFSSFNSNGQLTSLPVNSFDTSSISGIVGDSFFADFNAGGQLTSLPTGSFDISNITTVGNFFFNGFNSEGQLTALPSSSFDTSKISGAVGTYFFSDFNSYGQLISLPTGSFNISRIITVQDGFFSEFNDNGSLISLPESSFDTSNIIGSAEKYFFDGFNSNGKITNLPEGSFILSTGLNSVGDDFFYSFNYNGALVNLPEGSFDTSNITSAGNYFFDSFNYNGELTSLSDPFVINSVGATVIGGYENAFNSTGYTLNKKVSALISGVTVPSSDMNTFSDNQPGRCGVHANWLVTTANACSISYDDGLGGTGEVKYNADTTGIVAGSGMTEPTRSGYVFSGWQDVSGNKIDEVIFPDMDGQTLYAQWRNAIICETGYVLNADGTGCELGHITFDANGGNFSGGESTKNVDTRLVEVYQRIYKYSHTENVNDSGVKLSNYGNNWNNSNIRGTDRTSAVNEAHVVTITGANSLRVDLYYNGDGNSVTSPYSDHVSVWKGSHPTYIATGDTKSDGAVTPVDGGNSTNIYGGSQGGVFVVNGNTLINMGHNRLTIPGDTVTFGFTSNYNGYGQGYGYYAVVSSETDVVEGYECVYDISNPEREGYVFGGWFTDENFTHIFDTSACLSENTTVYAKWNKINTKDIIIEATSTEANQTLKINKYFSNNYVVDWGDGTVGNLSSDTIHMYSGAGIYNIVLSLTGGANRWTFRNQTYPYKSFVPQAGTTMSGVKIIYMPSLAEGFGESASNPGDYFFAEFNYQGAITSLPEGSFDTSSVTIAGDYFFDTFNSEGGLIKNLPEGSFNTRNITSVGNRFFSYFSDGSEGSDTYIWTLESLPEDSFDISNITTVGDSFFEGFNEAGGLTSLPEGSFKLSTGLTTVGNGFFYVFNEQGALESLPEDSFDISNITSVGYSFFSYFNWDGQLTSLPVGSFRLSTGLTTAGDSFFYVFNSEGALESLPEGSFDTSNITSAGNFFFYGFNELGQLTSLPENSFDTSNITTVGNYFFSSFNSYGQLTSLPEGSFRLSTGLTTVGNYFFSSFNDGGQLTSLPEGSFKTENITTVGNSFFSYFNELGQLTSLPEGSFDTSNVTTAGNKFFSSFNYSGAITNLPDSFKLNPLGVSSGTGYYASYKNAFNSTGYTLNKKVSDLVSGMTVPLDDIDTFSDNQPGRCGVADNWLVNPAGTCDLTVTFNANGGAEIDPESASSGDKIILPTTTKTGYILSGWYDELSGGNKIGDAGDIFTVLSSQTLYAQWKPSKDIILEATSTATNQTLKINKYFANDYTVDWGDGSPVETVSADKTHTYTGAGTYTITLSLSGGNRWTFALVTKPLVPRGSPTTVSNVKITYMPSLADGFGNSATAPGNYFFYYFNYNGALWSLPEGSFDTSNITTAGGGFFEYFNMNGAWLKSLPAGSFDISNIKTVQGDGFFNGFNYKGALTSLPTGSFNISGISGAALGSRSYFFASFNAEGKLTSLPTGSFDTSHITSVASHFFYCFNSNGKLTSLPSGSFDISNITSVGYYFFQSFNYKGALISLPEGSFNTSNIRTVGQHFFRSFNNEGKLTSLPEGSFDTSNITTAGANFFMYFNYTGALTNLPDSFKLSSVGASAASGYRSAFYSKNYVLNKKVSDLVSGVTVPLDDRNTFSDNQPGRCGVHENWLVNKTNACSISYDDGVGGTGEFKYDADTTGVVVGSGISVPTRSGYIFSGWYDASGNKVDEVLFPEMDRQTLHAEWNEVYTITYNLDGGAESRTNPTTYTVTSGTFGLYQPTKAGAMFLGWTGSNGTTPNANIYITQGSTGNRTYNAVWGTYEDIDAYFISSTGAVSNITLMDRNMGASMTGAGENAYTGSYGFHYQWGNNNGFQIGCWVYGGNTCSDVVSLNSTGTKATRNNDYNNKGYDGVYFIKGGYDYWIEDSHYDSLRGGGGDSVGNQWGLSTITSENITDRQGPCPVGYHVPSIGEWNNLLKYRVSAYTGAGKSLILSEDTSYELNYFTDGNVRGIFQQDFSVPSAGLRRNDDGLVSLQNIRSLFRSSSPYDVDYPYRARYFNFDPTHIYASYFDNRSDAQSVRCFSNDYLFTQPSMTVHPNGGTGGMIIVEGNTIKTLSAPKKDKYVFKGWYSTSEFTAGSEITTGSTAPTNLYAKWEELKDIILEATSTAANQILKINKYFNNAYTVDWGDGTTGNLTADTTHTYSTPGTYTITLSLSGADRWTFKGTNDGLVPQEGTTMTGVKVTYMPSLADGFGNSATNPGNNFFHSFNNYGALTSVPTGSFDTSKITTVGDHFFRAFNFGGQLTSLPENSFNISNISGSVGIRFFANFNRNGALTSLPAGSFDTSNITKVGNNFFWNFNAGGVLTSLPENSFNISNISSIGNEFFRDFNVDGYLTSLPTGSFNTSNISGTVGSYFFQDFNRNGHLVSLPTGSFDISNITAAGERFFDGFNMSGSIISLPEGSFRFSTGLTTTKEYFFSSFNKHGQLTSLPEGSFDISNIDTVESIFFAQFNDDGSLVTLPEGSFKLSTGLTVVVDYFFHGFNREGGLISLPEGSFDASHITAVGNNFFFAFNRTGSLEDLPEGSFDTSHVTTAGTNFLGYFNSDGKITNLPDSFKMSSVGASAIGGYDNAFNSLDYTFNRKVSDLVSGVTAPSSDMDTFSDNQPGRCGVDANWLVTPENACSISYDDGQGGTGEFKYNADTTGVVVGSGMTLPTVSGYAIEGWYTASGEKVDEVIFPEMDGQTLYARRNAKMYTITYNLDGGEENRTNPTTYTIESGTFGLYQPTKTGYMFLGWTGSNGDTQNANVYITQGSTGNRTYNAVWGTYENIDAYFISNTGAVSYITLMDRNMGASMTGTWDNNFTGSFGFKYQWGNNQGFQDECRTHSCSDIISINKTSTKVDWNPDYDNSNYWGTIFVNSSETYGQDYWSDSVANSGNHMNLWGGGGDTSSNQWGLSTITAENIADRQGPCPEGYHVPTIQEWNNLIVYWYNAENKANRSSSSLNFINRDGIGIEFSDVFNIPYAGYRNYSSAKPSYQYNYVFLWSSSPVGSTDIYTRYISLVTGTVRTNVATLGRSSSLPVRCFSNDYLFTQPSMNVVPNGGTGAMILVEGGDVKSLGTPNRVHSKFEGWYSNSALTTAVATGDTAPSSIYAKWSCDTGYVQNESGNACILEVYTITYNLNGGTNNENNPSTYTIESGAITLQQPTKTGYTFLGWTGANGNTPQTGVIISAGSYGNKVYNAVWTENNNTLYMVKYYKHNIGNASYTLESTRTLSGTTNATVNISDLVKFITGYTFESGYANTGTTTKPTAGAVTTTTILPDGSRVINLYYRPNYLYVQYDMNGGYLATRHGDKISTSGSLITVNGNTKSIMGFYGSVVSSINLPNHSINGDGLNDYNNVTWINILRDGYYVITGTEWNSQANGQGTTYNQASNSYGANGFAGASLVNGDAEVTVYVNWVLRTYTITYNLNGGTNNVNNPSTYTVESGDIILQSPTKTGYTFLGWTGSNGNTPQTGVIILSGSYGNKTYNATWQANTNTPYTVYHYVKRVGENTYALTDTETRYGTTDEILTLSSLSKENEFLCAKYDKGSLTGTEDGPGVVLTQTTLKGDGSLKIYLYYTRNTHRVILSGDEHVEYLKISGELYDESEAVRECGSEVPVEAIPKPGYHFVRWDRERDREETEEENNDTSGG